MTVTLSSLSVTSTSSTTLRITWAGTGLVDSTASGSTNIVKLKLNSTDQSAISSFPSSYSSTIAADGTPITVSMITATASATATTAGGNITITLSTAMPAALYTFTLTAWDNTASPAAWSATETQSATFNYTGSINTFNTASGVSNNPSNYFTSLLVNISNLLDTINNTFFNKSFFVNLGTSIYNNAYLGGGASLDTILNSLLNSTPHSTTEYTLSSAPSLTTNIGILQYNNNSIRNTYDKKALNTITASPMPNLRDVNCMLLYKDNSASSTLIKTLQGYYAWHNLLIPSNWSSFIQGNNTIINIPDINANNLIIVSVTLNYNNGTPVVSSIIQTDPSSTASANTTLYYGDNNLITTMDSIINFMDLAPVLNTINIYVMRQLFYLYIQMVQYNMACGAYSSFNGTPSSQSYALNLIYNIESLLNTLASENSSLQNLLLVTQNRVNEYSDSTNDITNLNNNILRQKSTLVSNQSKINDQNKNIAIIRKFELASIIILCVVVAGSCALIMLPIEYSKKLTFCLLLVVIAIISSFIISALFNKSGINTVEYFRTSPANIVANSDTTIAPHDNYFYGIVSTYLSNIINNTTALQSYNIYGNVNYALQKEKQYYTDTNKEIINVNARMDSVYKISFLDQTQRTALMNFLMSATIISAAIAMAYVALEKYEKAARFVLYFGLFLISISLAIYILEVTQRVRTDGDKIYWGAPSSHTLNRII